MFLDEKLQQIFDKLNNKVCLAVMVLELKKVMMRELLLCESKEFINQIKKIDYAWRLFCDKNQRFNADLWCTMILDCDDNNKFKNALGW